MKSIVFWGRVVVAVMALLFLDRYSNPLLVIAVGVALLFATLSILRNGE